MNSVRSNVLKALAGFGRQAAIAASLATSLSVAGCAEYVERRETISYSAGDAIAANKALQIIDPWDRRAGWTDIDQDGNRAVAAVDAYRAGDSEASDTVGGSATGQTQ